jgi:DNA-directed RNA polymerase specialized sigma24 family protein
VNTPNFTLAQSCAAATARLVTRHQISILSPVVFADLTQTAMQEGRFTSPEQAALHIYALALYYACSASDPQALSDTGTTLEGQVAGAMRRLHPSLDAAQTQAYTELYAYLHDIARYRHSDLREDIAQTALEYVFTKIVTCRAPGAFLKFVTLQLALAARQLRRQDARVTCYLDAPLPDAEALTLGEVLADEHAACVLEEVEASNVRLQVAHCIEACVRRHPRARIQLAAVWLKFIAGLDDSEISRRLDKSAAGIYTARSRGLRLLATAPEFQQLAVELGMIQEQKLAS